MTLRMLFLSALSVGVLSSSCSWIRQVPDPELAIGQVPPEYQRSLEPNYFEGTLVGGSTDQYVKDLSADQQRLLLAPDAALVVQGVPDPARQESARKECLSRPLQLRFAWYSDVQLRQRDVKLFSRNASQTLDRVQNSFESDPMQEEYGWAVYLSHLLALNNYQRSLHDGNATQAAKEPLLQFYIHTGDAIDAGTIEELYRFVYLSNQLDFPWLNVVGNHDYSVFGNYDGAKNYTVDSGVAFYPVGQLKNFLYLHGVKRQVSGFGPHLLPTPSSKTGMGHYPTLHGCYAPGGGQCPVPTKPLIPGSDCHGFDLPQPVQTDHPFKCENQLGYYSFDLDHPNGSPLKLRVVVLNSEEQSRWGSGSTIHDPQRNWLANVLQTASDRTTLLFVHHRIDELSKEVREVILGAGHGPLIAFTGHTHRNDVALFTTKDGHSIYELNAGSLMTSPQVGRIIELRGQGPSGCAVSRAVWPTLMAETPTHLAPVRLTEAEQQEHARCDEKRMTTRKDFKQAVRCGHLGATKDYYRSDVANWGRPQPFDTAWPLMNVIVPLELSIAPPAQSQQNPTPQ